MREKFKKFRDGLSLEQVEKITTVVTVIFEIIILILIVCRWEETSRVLSNGTNDNVFTVFCVLAIMFCMGVCCALGVWMFLGGEEKEYEINKAENAEKIKEKFKLPSSEYTEIILTANTINDYNDIKKMLLSHEKAAGIKYFARMAESGEYFYIISKMGDKMLMTEKPCYNWRYLEANFEPKEPENETTET